MNSSGMKRGLAVSAISALAVAGLPLFATPALAAKVSPAGPASVSLLSQQDAAGADVAAGTKYDGKDATITLTAVGSSDVIKVQFQYQDVSAAPGTWVNIGSAVTPANGVFTTTWNGGTVIGQNDILIRAQALDLNNQQLATDGTAGQISVAASNAETVDIANAAGSDFGLYKSVAAGDVNAPADAMRGAVTGTSSLGTVANGIALDARAGGTAAGTADTTAATVAAGAAPFSNFAGALVFNPDYTFTPGGGDELVIGATTRDGGQDDSDDTVSVVPYTQLVTSVEAVAKSPNVAVGGNSDITVTVKDQKGNPIAGAQVVRSGGSEATAADVRYTDAKGQAVYAAQGAGTRSYYVNTTATNGYDAAIDKKSGDVVISEFVPGLAKITATSVDGPAFDEDEYANGDVKIQTKDQNGNPIATNGIYYRWTITPFNPAIAPTTTPEAGPINTTLVGVAPNQRAEATVPVPTGVSGTYTLNAYTKSVGGIGGYNEATVTTLKIGEAEVVFDGPSTKQGPIGQPLTLNGVLELEDGTALGSIDRADNDPLGDVTRTLNMAYSVGTENGGAGDSRIAPSANQAGPQALYVVANDNGAAGSGVVGGLSGQVQVTADGKVAVKINDQSGETAKEKGAALTLGGGAFSNSTQNVDFLVSLDPATLTPGAVTNLFGAGATPGRPANVTVTVRNNDNDVLTGVPVTVTVDNGGFLTPTAANASALTAVEAGGLYGRWVNSGATQAVNTNGNGVSTATVAIERAAGFDDDFANRVGVTFSAGGVSTQLAGGVNFVSQNALNLADATLTVSPETVADTDEDIQTREAVFFDVQAKDQFGNLVSQAVSTNDADNPDAGFDNLPANYTGGPNNPFVGSTLPAVQTGGASTFTAFGTDDTVQNITATVTGNSTAASATDQNLTLPGVQVAGASTVNNKSLTDSLSWYVIDFAESVFSIEADTEGPVEKGTPVIVTVRAVDQRGNGIRQLATTTIRQGPETTNGNFTQGGSTDENGEETYFFSGSVPGLASISTQFTDFLNSNSNDPTGDEVGVAGPLEIVFTEPGGDPQPIDVSLLGSNAGEAGDRLTVDAPSIAAGAETTIERKTRKGWKPVAVGTLDANGNAEFVLADKNGKRKTKYRAQVAETSTSLADQSNKVRVR